MIPEAVERAIEALGRACVRYGWDHPARRDGDGLELARAALVQAIEQAIADARTDTRRRTVSEFSAVRIEP